MLETEFEIYEEDFVELGNQQEVETYASLLLDIASQKGNYDAGTRNFFVQELIMESKYHISGGNQGAVGDNAKAENFTQISNQNLDSVNLNELAAELSQLRSKAREQATDVAHDTAVLEIGKAEEAAKAGESSKVMEHLKSAGSWALNLATDIGAKVAVEAIKKSIGL